VKETPRSNRAALESIELMNGGVLRECKAMETELNAAAARIMRLEEALEAVAKVIGPPGKSTWVADGELHRAWALYILTKEVKP
jgi:hypothetical protein